MQIKIKGEMSITAIRQAIFETLHEVENEYAIRHSRGATLYLQPTDGDGDTVIPRSRSGKAIDKILCDGPYKSAADELKF